VDFDIFAGNLCTCLWFLSASVDDSFTTPMFNGSSQSRCLKCLSFLPIFTPSFQLRGLEDELFFCATALDGGSPALDGGSPAETAAPSAPYMPRYSLDFLTP
jgi:hypothetical protein